MGKRYFFKGFFLFIFFLTLTSHVFTEGQSTEERIIKFLDTHVPNLLNKHHVSGTVIAVVSDDTVILKGYGKLGFNYVEPMDAYKTPVFVASLSKLFTTTGILQLYEQGKISLDVDVNQYLHNFKITYPYEEFITIHHLFTHTAGFDDRFLGMGAKTREQVLPLGVYLSKRLPPIVFPPGTAISYSNHGFALLGHIIEEVSGKSFNDYMRENLFIPLEMENSRFDGSYPESLKLPELYLEYLGKTEVIQMDFAQTPPASSLCTTAEDFSHYLIAILNKGVYKGKLILQPETVQLILTPRYKLHPLLPGYACCWEERFINGKKVLQHSGLTWGFSSHTLIIPEEKFGLFISINKGTNGFIWDVIPSLIEKFTLPVKNVETVRKHPEFVSASFYENITGFYRFNRYCRSDYFKLATFLPGMVHEVYVKGNATERTISIQPLVFKAGQWSVREMGDMLWGRKNRQGEVVSSPRISFIKGHQKGPYQFVIGNDVYEPIYFWETKLFQYVLFFACVAVYLINLWRVILGLAIKRMGKIFKKNYEYKITEYQLLTICFLLYVFFFGMYLFLFLKPQTLGYGTPEALGVLILSPYFLSILTVYMSLKFLFTLQEWNIEKFFNLMSLTACYGLLFLFYYWNILSFNMSWIDTISF